MKRSIAPTISMGAHQCAEEQETFAAGWWSRTASSVSTTPSRSSVSRGSLARLQ
jgi:hypothetical protein